MIFLFTMKLLLNKICDLAINTVIMAVKKKIFYNDRLKTYDPATIKGIIECRMNVEKYLERKRGQARSRWDIIT